MFSDDQLHTLKYMSAKQHWPSQSYVKPFKACNTPYPLTKVWWQAAPVNDELSVRSEPRWTFTTVRLEKGLWINTSDTVWACLCECVRLRREDSSRSQFYEWKEVICQLFTIFGHGAVQRETFVYVAKNKIWQWSLRQRESHTAFTGCLLQLPMSLLFIGADLIISAKFVCDTASSAEKRLQQPNIQQEPHHDCFKPDDDTTEDTMRWC